MTDVEIEYCVPCGFLDRAQEVQYALLSSLGQEIDRCALVTGDHGVFRVRVNGHTVYDKDETAFDIDEIVRDVRSRL